MDTRRFVQALHLSLSSKQCSVFMHLLMEAEIPGEAIVLGFSLKALIREEGSENISHSD